MQKSRLNEVITMPLKITRNDIAEVEADIIVNPANPLPQIGGGSELSICPV